MYYLYIKTHNITNLKYLGYTSKPDPNKYKGSGIKWKSHLHVHGVNFSTTILLATENYEDIVLTGKFFSKLWNIVKSDEWANLKEESGDGGNPGNDAIEKIRASNSGKKLTETHKKNISANNKKYWLNKRHSRETTEKIRAKHLGDIVYNNGLVEIRLKSYELVPDGFSKGRLKVCCPHCNRIGIISAMHRWHFTNCKDK